MIRPAKAFDLAKIVALDSGSGMAPWSQADFEAFLDGPGRLLLAAEGEQIVAYAVFQVIPPEAELLRIVVDASSRGQGIGGTFLEACLNELVASGVESFYLEVRESNRAARTLYQHRGFRATGRRLDYYRGPLEDAILMRLELDSGGNETP